jgi:hypothetical protein
LARVTRVEKGDGLKKGRVEKGDGGIEKEKGDGGIKK